MSNEGDNTEVDLKMFIKAVNDQFRLLNARFDDLVLPSEPKSSRKIMDDEGEVKESDVDVINSRKGRRADQK